MSMEHKLIHAKDYLLVVSDEMIKTTDWCVMFDSFGNLFSQPQQYTDPETQYINKGHRKIIAHLPLNNAPYLEGVDVLPSFSWSQQDDVDKEAREFANNSASSAYEDGINVGKYQGFVEAKKKYKYTESDLRKAIELAETSGRVDMGHCRGDFYTLAEYNEHVKTHDEIIQSINQPKLPIAFECEMEYYYHASKEFYHDADFVPCSKAQYESIKQEIPTCPVKETPKTITNSEGRIEWVGKYIYEK